MSLVAVRPAPNDGTVDVTGRVSSLCHGKGPSMRCIILLSMWESKSDVADDVR